MIEYSEHFEFTNDVGTFSIEARTVEHPTGYGNGTLLVFDIESDFPYEKRKCFDIRYEPVGDSDGAAMLARRVIYNEFGVEV